MDFVLLDDFRQVTLPIYMKKKLESLSLAYFFAPVIICNIVYTIVTFPISHDSYLSEKIFLHNIQAYISGKNP